MPRWTLVVDRSYPKLGLEPGDVLSVEPGANEPVMIHRAAPVNYGAIVDAIECEALRPLHPREPIIALLARLAGAHRPGARGFMLLGGKPKASRRHPISGGAA